MLARLAATSHGVVTRAEVLRAGITAAELKQRIRVGALIREHKGVYRVGHRAPSVEARYMAAVKACGGGALLAGRAAGHLFGILRGGPPAPEVIQRGQRRPRGVHTRRSHWIAPTDATSWRSIPVTTIPRTLVDLAAVLTESELARAVHEADVRRLVSPSSVEAILGRRHNWPGARKLRRVIGGDVPVTLSRLESVFIARIGEAGLPIPQTNRPVDGRRVDCRWPERRLTVELDGYQYHRTRYAWEQDREREREARSRGDEFRRYTWTDVVENPGPMVADLHSLLKL